MDKNIEHLLNLPLVRRAVVDGTRLEPARVVVREQGNERFEIRTMWGELAWQLLGAEGYRMVAEADRAGTSPGESLTELLRRAAPCVILIDEWMDYLRQLYAIKGELLPAGSFDANISFAQALTNAARAVPTAQVVISLPQSRTEKGSEVGEAAQKALKAKIGRMDAPWQTATTEEGYQIVRRRLFAPLDPANETGREATVSAYMTMYRAQSGDFPQECASSDYERRMREAYPIHPDLFARLYEDWSELEGFQRTRGVLRLMATVIRKLWKDQNEGALIMPADLPLGDADVRNELTHWLENKESWQPIIEKEVDGSNALSREQDGNHADQGRYGAGLRVARTLFLGTAPHKGREKQNKDDKLIKLGCVRPGEVAATYGDALRRLSEAASHLYVENGKYWFATQPSVNRIAKDRAEEYAKSRGGEVEQELLERLKQEQRGRSSQRSGFASVHIAPGSVDVPDETSVRLVILALEHWHSSGATDSQAQREATKLLMQRGSGDRGYRNTVVFLAPDNAQVSGLQQAICDYLAWRWVNDNLESLNINDTFQRNTAKRRMDETNRSINEQRIPDTYRWLLVPIREEGQQVFWHIAPVGQGDGSLATRATRKLLADGRLADGYASSILRRRLDEVPLWDDDYNYNHVAIKTLTTDYAKYLYLDRLTDSKVLLTAIETGLRNTAWQQETFAYAEAWDKDKERYVGLRVGEPVQISQSDTGLLVKAEVAAQQLAAEAAIRQQAESTTTGYPATIPTDVSSGESAASDSTPAPAASRPRNQPRRFHGTVELDAERLERSIGEVANKVVNQLVGKLGARVKVTLEIEATLPNGTDDRFETGIMENSIKLNFEPHSEFEDN